MADEILHFLWSCSLGTLPCLSALSSRHIVTYSLCPRCHLYSETPLHATSECFVNVVMLERVSFYSKMMSGVWDSFYGLLSFAWSVLSKGEVRLLCVLLWLNWKERNVVVHGDQARDPGVLLDLGMSIWNGAE